MVFNFVFRQIKYVSLGRMRDGKDGNEKKEQEADEWTTLHKGLLIAVLQDEMGCAKTVNKIVFDIE